MGLKKDVTILDDIVVADAYFKILVTVVDWEARAVRYVLGCWKSRAASKNGKRQLPVTIQEETEPEFTDPETGMVIPARYVSRFPEISLAIPEGAEAGTKAEQYQMIKGLVPFFADAVDVLET